MVDTFCKEAKTHHSRIAQDLHSEFKAVCEYIISLTSENSVFAGVKRDGQG